MVKKLKIEGFQCHYVESMGSDTVTYMIYPELAQLEDKWIERMSLLHQVSIVMVYVPADKWNDALTPWAEPGEAKDFPPFAGKAADFLNFLQTKIIPEVEKAMFDSSSENPRDVSRDILGVSLGGLFSLWQWLVCDTFRNIACLSGSFWYNGFIEWFRKQPLKGKTGKAYFLLGVEEPHSNIKAYDSVGENTEIIIELLKKAGIHTEFEWVPGNHFSRPVHRAEKALIGLYGEGQ